jgi:DNA polymerase-1
MTFRLAALLGERLRENGLTGLFEEIEMPLVEVLDAMESEGVTLDTSVLDSLSRSLGAKIDTIAADVFRIAGHSFNIKSTQQVADVLFRELGLKPKRKTATGLSTSSEVLEELRESHPLPARILDYRHLEKILSTYVEALPRMVHPETGRIHTSYNQFIAATGRLSSSNPNLQNIPVRSVEGREIRRAFVPNHRGDVFLAADYSQIELRVLAHLSKDSELRRAFQENRDIHSQTAARIFGTPSEMVTEEMRSQAKVINFGILYGMGPHRLSRELSISHAQAGAFIEEYFRAYPAVREWIDKTIEEARKTGYVTTLSGRRRMIANMNSSNHNLRSNAERMAVNTPVQGTAADMVKFAMIALHQEIESSGRRARMVLQVHDELVFSLPEEEVKEFEPVVRERMQEALPLDVPLRVDTKTGKTWAEC